MRRWAHKLAVVLATGYILFFYSERVFWSFLRPGDKFADLLLGWLMYSLLAWVFLLLVRQCRIAAFPALFLAGAVHRHHAVGILLPDPQPLGPPSRAALTAGRHPKTVTRSRCPLTVALRATKPVSSFTVSGGRGQIPSPTEKALAMKVPIP
jgi:hypothetical protein